jgi:hypothetical protein
VSPAWGEPLRQEAFVDRGQRALAFSRKTVVSLRAAR